MLVIDWAQWPSSPPLGDGGVKTVLFFSLFFCLSGFFFFFFTLHYHLSQRLGDSCSVGRKRGASSIAAELRSDKRKHWLPGLISHCSCGPWLSGTQSRFSCALLHLEPRFTQTRSVQVDKNLMLAWLPGQFPLTSQIGLIFINSNYIWKQWQDTPFLFTFFPFLPFLYRHICKASSRSLPEKNKWNTSLPFRRRKRGGTGGDRKRVKRLLGLQAWRNKELHLCLSEWDLFLSRTQDDLIWLLSPRGSGFKGCKLESFGAKALTKMGVLWWWRNAFVNVIFRHVGNVFFF